MEKIALSIGRGDDLQNLPHIIKDASSNGGTIVLMMAVNPVLYL
jgi:hypothetical protein